MASRPTSEGTAGGKRRIGECSGRGDRGGDRRGTPAAGKSHVAGLASAARRELLSSRSFFPSTTPLYQLLALFGGYRRSRPQPDTPPPLPRTTSRLILRTRLAAPSSLFLRWPHQDLRHSGSTIATRPTRPRTARRPAQELAARGGVRGPKTHLEPPRSRASNRSAHLEGLDRSPTYPAATATSLPVLVDLCDPFGSGMGSR